MGCFIGSKRIWKSAKVLLVRSQLKGHDESGKEVESILEEGPPALCCLHHVGRARLGLLVCLLC